MLWESQHFVSTHKRVPTPQAAPSTLQISSPKGFRPLWNTNSCRGVLGCGQAGGSRGGQAARPAAESQRDRPSISKGRRCLCLGHRTKPDISIDCNSSHFNLDVLILNLLQCFKTAYVLSAPSRACCH